MSKKKIGRPTDYTKKLGDEICSLLAEGKSMRTVAEMKGMPDKATIFRWIRTDKDFRHQYARAKEEASELFIEEMIDIADGAEKIVRSGAEKKSSAYAQTQRLRIDTRKWIASKLKPKKYGDKLDLTSKNKAIKGNVVVFKDFKDATVSK